MTRRRSSVERAIEDIGDAVLSDLPSGDRAALVVQHQARGDADKVDQLFNSAPESTYDALDLDFIDEIQTLQTEALFALWRLQDATWRFHYHRVKRLLQEAHYRLYPDAEWTTEPAEENEYHEGDAMEAAVVLLGHYRAWKWYATEEIGVSLKEFLLHPCPAETAASRVDMIEATARLADGRRFDGIEDDIGWASGETVAISGEELTADEFAEQVYCDIVNRRERA